MSNLKEFFKKHGLLVLIVTLFVATKVLYAQKFHNVIWDEAVYLGIGKYIYSFGTVGLWEMIRPIGIPLMIGGFWKLGLDYVLAAEILEIVFAAGVIITTYLITREFTDNWSATAAAFIVSITPVFFLYSGYILTGIPSTFFTTLAFYFFLKKKYVGAGVVAGIASLFRYPQGLFFGCVMIALGIVFLLKKSKKIWEAAKKFTIAFVLTHVPFFIFNYLMYRHETSRLHHALFRPWILASTHSGNLAEAVTSSAWKFLWYPQTLYAMNALVVLAFVGLIYLGLKYKKYELQKILALVMVPLLYLLYFGDIVNKQDRFLIPMLPFIAVLCGMGVYMVAERLHALIKRQKKSELFHNVKLMHVYVFLGVLIFAYAYNGPMEQNDAYYGWRTFEPPAIVTEYYQFLANNPPQKQIITADPAPVAYVDAKFVPIYFSIDAAEKIYKESLAESSHLIYANETFFCPEWHDDCKQRVKAFDAEVRSSFTPLIEKQYGDRLYWIYEVNN